MSDHKDWATPENLYRAADNADAAGFTEYGWKLQGSAERIESLWAEIEALQRENERLEAENKDLHWRCGTDSELTERIEALQRENEELKGAAQANAIQAMELNQGLAKRNMELEAAAITPEMREKIENLLAELTDVPDEAEWKRRNESRDMMIIPGLSFRMCWALRDLLGEQG